MTLADGNILVVGGVQMVSAALFLLLLFAFAVSVWLMFG